MRLVNMPSSCFNPSKFAFLSRLVVLAQVKSNSSVVFRPNSSTISNINNIQIIIERHNQIGTTSGFALLHFLSCL